MRRSTPGAALVAAEQARLLAALRNLDVAGVVGALEPFATPERCARLRHVFAARLDSVTVLMDAPHDPHNGAAVIRSCDAFGVARLHIVERIEEFLAARTVARGSQRWVEVCTYRDAQTAIGGLRASGHVLVGADPDGELVPSDLARVLRVALVLGNERQGIHQELYEACDKSVRIPMRGFAESLNVSVTAAIMLERATEGRAGDLSEAETSLLYARALILTIPHASEILTSRGIRVEA